MGLYAKSFSLPSGYVAGEIVKSPDADWTVEPVAEAVRQVDAHHREQVRKARQIPDRLGPGEELVAIAIKGVDGQIRTENVE